MTSAQHQRMYRHPDAPWAELRICVNTHNCYRLHMHAEYSVGIVDEGEAVFRHPQGPQQLQPGSVVLIEPNVPHACNPLRGRNWSYRMLYVDASWLQQEMAEHAQVADAWRALTFRQRAHGDPESSATVDRLCRPVASAADAAHLARGLVGWLAHLACPATPERMHTPADLAPAWQLLHANQDCRVSVLALADACGMSPAPFIRRFSAAYGMTPGNYARNQRLNEARRLIAQGISLADAAHAAGFADQAHLQRTFKRHHAMTPGSYAGKSPLGAPGGT